MNSPDNMKPVICIAGPTASGKSAMAVRLAKNYGGEIINADSMQVYADLRVLSARPTVKEMQDVPHHLFGHVDGRIRYSVGTWVKDAIPVILDCLARDKYPILVGGTGLYFQALTRGLAQIPDPAPKGMSKANVLLETGIDELRREAERLDPKAAARVLGNDPQRLLRIVSVALGTDRPLSAWQDSTKPEIPNEFWRGAVILPDRAGLYQRINQRFDAMAENGGIAEAKAVLERRLDPSLPVMKAIGLPPLMDHLEGKLSLEEAIERAKRDTRRFAKRQFTWLRGQNAEWTCVDSQTPADQIWQNIA